MLAGEVPRRYRGIADDGAFGQYQSDGAGTGLLRQLLANPENRCGGEQPGKRGDPDSHDQKLRPLLGGVRPPPGNDEAPQ